MLALLASPVLARTEKTSSSASRVDTANLHIDNFGRVNSNYFRGAQPVGRDYADLAAFGVKALINLTSDDVDPAEKGMAEQAGMRYFQIPMTTHRPPTTAQLAEFLKIVNDPENQPVYVHCVGGRHRTGVMTAVFRMTAEGWTPDQAFQEMKSFRYGADFLHPEFKEFVYQYRPASVQAADAAPSSTPTARRASF
jgi:tyrosine-protein phosphatase SIW14